MDLEKAYPGKVRPEDVPKPVRSFNEEYWSIMFIENVLKECGNLSPSKRLDSLVALLKAYLNDPDLLSAEQLNEKISNLSSLPALKGELQRASVKLLSYEKILIDKGLIKISSAQYNRPGEDSTSAPWYIWILWLMGILGIIFIIVGTKTGLIDWFPHLGK